MSEMEFFDPQMIGWKKDGKIYPNETEGALAGAKEYKGWTAHDVECWAEMLRVGASDSFSPNKDSLDRFVQEIIEESTTAQIRHSKCNDVGSLKSKVDVDDMPIKAPNITMKTIDELGRDESSGGSKLGPEKWRGLMMGMKDYLEVQHKRISKYDFEKGYDPVTDKASDPVWNLQRKRVLEDVARVMKLAFKIEQLLVGNYVAEGKWSSGESKTYFLREDAWNGKTSYPPEKSARFINGITHNLFKNQNFFQKENDKFKDYMKQKGKKGFENANFEELFDLDSRGAVMQDKREYYHEMSRRINFDNAANEYFEDTKEVWKALDGYMKK